MRRTTILLDPAVLIELEDLARRTRRPTAHVIREAMERYIAQERSSQVHALPEFVGLGRGPGDVASRDEEILRRELPEAVAPPRRRRRRQRR